jgi:hypothetical protein
MAHAAEMSVTANAIEELIRELAEHPVVARKALHFLPVASANFNVTGPNALVWGWPAPESGRRGLSLAYHDLDGQIVILSMMAIGGEVVEIELMRGDGEQPRSSPKQSELWEMLPGRIYSPRPVAPT